MALTRLVFKMRRMGRSSVTCSCQWKSKKSTLIETWEGALIWAWLTHTNRERRSCMFTMILLFTLWTARLTLEKLTSFISNNGKFGNFLRTVLWPYTNGSMLFRTQCSETLLQAMSWWTIGERSSLWTNWVFQPK